MKTSTILNVDTKADALGVRRLLITLCLGSATYVASLFLIIPEWTGLTRDVWLTITVLLFFGAVAYVFLTLAAYAPAQGSEPKGNVPLASKPLPPFASQGGPILKGSARA